MPNSLLGIDYQPQMARQKSMADLLNEKNPLENYTGDNPKKYWGLRNTPEQGMKGEGYFGVLPERLSHKQTEVSVGGDLYGQPLEYPSLVPTLTAEEVQMIQRGKTDFSKNIRGGVNDSIERKAKQWAMDRIRQGLSPYAEEGEQYFLPK